MNNADRTGSSGSRPDRCQILAASSLLLVVIGWLMLGTASGQRHAPLTPDAASTSSPPGRDGSVARDQRWRRRFGGGQSQTAEQVLNAKLTDFSRKRLEWVRAKSLRIGQDVPPEVEEFFKTMERGKWDEIDAAFQSLAKRSAQYEHSTHWAELDPFWSAVLEAYGAAEQGHLWPADKLLEYGNDILASLKPGMVYVGGTDPGRFVPTFLNETTEGEQHIILTQNALADSRYLEYARSLYGDKFALPSTDDSSRIFDEYVQDARKRFDHDQQFPDEPKQIKPGEKVEVVDGKTQVSGQVAVMAINEKLLQWMIDRNPSASFAVEESFPMRSTYTDAMPLGPITEIRSQTPFDEKDATDALDRWRDLASSLKGIDPGGEDAVLKTYAKMAIAQANVLAARNFPEQAEATYKLAAEIFPRSSDAVMSYAQFLSDAGRVDEARRALAEFQKYNPDLIKDIKPGMILTRDLTP